MDIAALRTFEAVARLGGMGRAAAELNTVQSNVTARIRQLEQELDRPLFDRHSRGVSLNTAGRRLLPYAREILQLADAAGRAVRDDGSPSGPLTIGALETTTALRLAPLIARYCTSFPEVDFNLRTGTTAELVDAVLQRALEGAFVAGPVEHPRLEATAVFREELCLLAAERWPGLEAALAAPDLKLLVLRSGCSYRQRLEDLLARRGIVAARVQEFGTLEAIVACVAAGVGVTLLPRDLTGNVWPDRGIACHALPTQEGLVDTVFIRRSDTSVSSAQAALLDLIRQEREVAGPAIHLVEPSLRAIAAMKANR